MSNIGMMDAAFFVGRVELLNWLNDLLKLDYTKVEQTCTGAAHCQIMDAIYPGQVALHKIKWDAKQEYEYVANFKILQTVFEKMGIDKYIDVGKLVKGKYQDNLEFLQWIKRYYELHTNGGEYNALERRKDTSGKVPKPAAPAKKTEVAKPKPTGTPTGTTTVSRTPVSKEPAKPVATKKVTQEPKSSPAPKDSGGAANQELQNKINELNQQVADLKITVDGLEKERDFYFGKLREIEVISQTAEPEADFTKAIFKILYATDESSAEGVEQPQEEVEQPQEEAQPQEDDLEAF